MCPSFLLYYRWPLLLFPIVRSCACGTHTYVYIHIDYKSPMTAFVCDHIYPHTYVNLHTYITYRLKITGDYLCIYNIYINIRPNTYVYIHIGYKSSMTTYAYIHIHVYMCIYVNTYIYIYVRIHTYIYI